MTPAAALDKVLPRWRATLPSHYSAAYVDGFIRRNRAALEAFVAQAMARRRRTKSRPPHWFECYNPRGGVPRESLPGYRRAREHAAVIFDRALALLDEPTGEIDLASALAVLGSTDDEGEYEQIADPIWDAERHLELRSIDKDQACDFVARHHSLLPYSPEWTRSSGKPALQLAPRTGACSLQPGV